MIGSVLSPFGTVAWATRLEGVVSLSSPSRLRLPVTVVPLSCEGVGCAVGLAFWGISSTCFKVTGCESAEVGSLIVKSS